MGYAIICDARKGSGLGINTLALVDRALTKSTWWTSDNPSLILNYQSKSAALYARKRLKMNQPMVVTFESAVKIIRDQMNEITHQEAMASTEDGWDGHKAWTTGQ